MHPHKKANAVLNFMGDVFGIIFLISVMLNTHPTIMAILTMAANQAAHFIYGLEEDTTLAIVLGSIYGFVISVFDMINRPHYKASLQLRHKLSDYNTLIPRRRPAGSAKTRRSK